MLTEQYFVFECDVCERTLTLSMRDPVTAPTCPSCGTPITGEADAVVERQRTPWTQGFFECFDCGHTFGYSDTGTEHVVGDLYCPHCGADDVSQI